MWPVDRPPKWVDRSQELATVRAGVEALRHGEGAAVWVEGEPGIGGSEFGERGFQPCRVAAAGALLPAQR